MYPLISIGKLVIGTYGICCVLGGGFALLLALFNCRYSKLNRYDLIEASALVILGAVLGAKLLYFIVDFDFIMDIFKKDGFNMDTLMSVMQGGFVFYGGFMGGLAAIMIYAKTQKKTPWLYIMTIAPGIPLAHAFGRVGCFMAGCCYGIPSEEFGIAFTHSLGAPNGIKLFPVQLLEAALLLILSVIMQFYMSKTKRHHCTVYIYIFLYPIIRIFTERFRYDDSERGIYLGLSTSTWISLCIIAVGIILLVVDIKKGCPEPVCNVSSDNS
ncbi:MAG: prolipoprotein diacylglyceryl transferase [Ruminococcus sp.]|nr:prolipoprotein diacylglyceryl transferase [Ruminococcus sp.]